MASSPGVPARLDEQTPSSRPKFMPPVTLDSFTPHPYLPLQPDKSQFIIQPKKPDSSQPKIPVPKDILAAAKGGNLEWVKRYSTAGQAEWKDGMGEVLASFAVIIKADNTLDRLTESE
jgi:hypothetical protein